MIGTLVQSLQRRITLFSTKRQLHIRVVGGLGNQLFVYFAGLYLSKVSGRELVLNMKGASRVHSSFDLLSFSEISGVRTFSARYPMSKQLARFIDSFNYRFSRISAVLNLFAGNYVDQGIHINTIISQSSRCKIKLTGYFQDFEYLNGLQNSQLTLIASDQDSTSDEKTLAIHIRRGDFVNEKVSHGCLAASWYHRAISHQLSTSDNIKQIKVFSNDDEWVKANLNRLVPQTAVPVEIIKFNQSQDPAFSFMAFATCGYRVCSNSTFSLLGSKLFPGVTVVPYPYNRSGHFEVLEESSPKNWIRIASIWEE
jgi:hypothetical protein